MFNNLGLHTEIFTPLSIVLMVIGAILVYGAKLILHKIYKKEPTMKALIILKTVGLILVLIAMYLIFKK